MNNENFFQHWKIDMDKVSHVLQYLHTYPILLTKLKIEDLITSGELIQKR